jgi:putative ABC transport system permease protein
MASLRNLLSLTLSLKLPLQLLWRNWRSGEVKILGSALMLAVAVVTAIAVFADRMENSLVRQSNSYLAADRVVKSRFVVPEEWRTQSAEYALKQANIAEFSSMVMAKDDMQLASIKAVSPEYPLRGTLDVSTTAFAIDAVIEPENGIPKSGEVWVDSRLLLLMDLSLGESIGIGAREFIITQVVIREPDFTGGFGVLGPRVLMNIEDLDTTGVVLPGSLVTYRWLLAGEESNLDAFANWLKPQLGEHYRWVALKEAQSNIGSALDRGTRFLMLAGIIGVLLASVAISIAAQQFSKRHIDQVALIKSLGVSAQQVRQLYFSQLFILGLLASLAGILIGEVLQRLIAASLTSLFNVDLLPASPTAYLAGLSTGLLCLLCFALPPLWHLPKISPLRVLRREMPVATLQNWARGLLGIAAIMLLVWVYSGDSQLTLAVIGGLLGIIATGAAVGLLLLRTGQVFGAKAGSIWRLALANLQRYRQQTLTQMMVFACALMLLMVLFMVRTSLLDEWRLQLPANAPNHFILNISPYEKTAIEALFTNNDFTVSPMYPMVLGRLTAVNDTIFGDVDRDRSNTLRRELNLSWTEDIAPDNILLRGQWWDKWQGKTLSTGVSVEEDTAKDLNLDLGDVITFSLGGLTLQAEVASIRSVDWNSMTPNFYFLFSPSALDNFSPNYLTSLLIPPENKTFINTLLRQYPTIVVIEVDRIIARVRSIVDQVSRSIELVLWLVCIGGLLVLVAAVNTSMSNRLQEAALLRAFGSGRKLILGSVWFEFSMLGGCAGILATAGAEALLLGLQVGVFDQPASPHYLLWLTGPLLGAFTIGIFGLIACRKIISVSPGLVLREIE